MMKINTAYFHPQVFSRLWYPIVRQGALTVLSHMLLSFQHSPEAFHLVRDLLSLISLSLMRSLCWLHFLLPLVHIASEMLKFLWTTP